MSRVDSSTKTQKTQQAKKTNEPDAAEEVADLDEVSVRADVGPAASFDDEAGGMSLVGGGVERDAGRSVEPSSGEREIVGAVQDLGVALEGASLETNGLVGPASELHEDFGTCYADAGTCFSEAAYPASEGRADAVGERMERGEALLRSAAGVLQDAAGGAARVLPGTGAVMTVVDAFRDVGRVTEAAKGAPEKAAQLLDKTVEILTDLETAKQTVRDAYASVANGLTSQLEELQPGESVKVSVGGGVGVGAVRGGGEGSVTIARQPDGTFVVETESKSFLGAGKKSTSGNEAVGKGEGAIKVQWAANNAEDARDLAAQLSAGKLLGKETLVQGALLATSPEKLKSVEITGASAVELAGKLAGGDVAKLSGTLGGEVAHAVKLDFEGGELRGWEASVSGKVKGEVALKLGEDVAAGAIGGGVEVQQSVKISGRLRPGASLDGLLSGDTSSFRAEGESKTEAQLAIDMRDEEGGVKVEGGVTLDALADVGQALQQGDVSAAARAFTNAHSTTKVTRYDRRTATFGGAVDGGAADGELVGKYDRVLERESWQGTGPLAAQVKEAWTRLSDARGPEGLKDQLARGRAPTR